jgi:hypothetical protein
VAERIEVMGKVHPRARRAGLREAPAAAYGFRRGTAVAEASGDGRVDQAACDALAATFCISRTAVTLGWGAANRVVRRCVPGVAADLRTRMERILA